MKEQINRKASSLLHKYYCLLHEIIAQRHLYETESDFWAAWCKYGMIVNKLQRTIINH